MSDMAARFWYAAIVFGAFLLIYWWRRRNRGGNLALSESSRRLHEMVEGADTEIVKDSLKGEDL